MKILSSSTLWHFDMFFFSGKDLIYHCRREGARRGVRTLGRLVEAPDLEALLPGQSVETSQGWSLRGLSALPIPSSRGGCLDWILPPGPLLNPLWAAIIAPKVRQANLISNLFFFFFPLFLSWNPAGCCLSVLFALYLASPKSPSFALGGILWQSTELESRASGFPSCYVILGNLAATVV